MHERHRDGRCGAGHLPAILANLPYVAVCLRGATSTHPAEIVETDRRIGACQIDVAVDIAQQTVGHTIRQGPKLFFGVLDDWPQSRIACENLPPVEPAYRE